MAQFAAAATSMWGLASILFLAAALAAGVLLRGQARAFGASLAGFVAVLLAVVAVQQAPPQGEVTPEQALAGLQTDIPRTDRDIAAAIMARARQESNTGNNDAARKSYDLAKQTYRAARDTLGEASAVLGTAQLEHMIGQSARARTDYQQALTLFQQGGSALGQARTYASMGDLEKDTFQWDKAAEYYRQARRAWQRAPEPKSDPHVMLGIEDVPLLRNGEANARATLAQARKVYEQLGNQAGLGDLDLIQAQLEMRTGRIDVARGQFLAARSLYFGVGDFAMQAEATLQVVLIDIGRGYNRQAQAELDDARDLFAKANDTAGAGLATVAAGDLERLQGRLTTARDHYAAAAALLGAAGHRAEAEAWRKLGEVETSLGRHAEARAALDKAIPAARRGGSREEEQAARIAAIAAARAAGDLATAQILVTAAQVVVDQTKSQAGRALLALEFAAIKATEANPLATQNAYADALNRAQAAGLPFGIVLAQLGLGDAHRAGGTATEAAAAYRAAQAAWDALANRTKEANRLLGLPAVDTLLLVTNPTPADFYVEIDNHPEDLAPDPVLVKANVDEFPRHNLEARTLVERTDARLAATRN